jgi:hypothetical protein
MGGYSGYGAQGGQGYGMQQGAQASYSGYYVRSIRLRVCLTTDSCSVGLCRSCRHSCCWRNRSTTIARGDT